MVKEKKFFRRQAERAEQAAGRTSDPERAEGLRALATAFRVQADAIKGQKLKQKKLKQKRRKGRSRPADA